MRLNMYTLLGRSLDLVIHQVERASKQGVHIFDNNSRIQPVMGFPST